MTLQEKIINDFRVVQDVIIKNFKDHLIDLPGEKTKLQSLRVIIAELQREPTKEVSDDRVIKVLRKLITNEAQMPAPDQDYIKILEGYLPQEATDEEISQWINKNIDFTAFKNKMQAMGPIMKEFAGKADGSRVKKILQEF